MKSFPQHVLHFLSSYHQGSSVFQSCCHRALPRWPAVSGSRFQEVGVTELLTLECEVVGVSVTSTTVQHHMAGLCVASARIISKGKDISAYNCLVINTDLSEQSHLRKECDEGNMADSISKFERCSKVLPNMESARSTVKNWCWIVESLFCAKDYINNAKYLTGDTTPTAN